MSKLDYNLLDLIISSAEFNDSVTYEASSGANYSEHMGHVEVNKPLFFGNPEDPESDSTLGNLRVIVGETPDQTYVSINCNGHDICSNEIELEHLLNKEIFGENHEQRINPS